MKYLFFKIVLWQHAGSWGYGASFVRSETEVRYVGSQWNDEASWVDCLRVKSAYPRSARRQSYDGRLKMSGKKFVAAIVSLTTLSLAAGITGPASAKTWKVCNHTPHDVRVAVAYHKGDVITSKGWYRIRACGDCKTLVNEPLEYSLAWLRGVSDNVRIFEGETLLCIKSAPFEMARANRSGLFCSRNGGKMEAFQQVNLTSNIHTTNLNGQSSGRTCLD